MYPYQQETADLGTFTEEILNGKPHFWCSVSFIDHFLLFILFTMLFKLLTQLLTLFQAFQAFDCPQT